MNSSITYEINRICDKVPNPKRTNADFCRLFKILSEHPKECISHKGQILQHVNLNTSRNTKLDLRLTSSIYARASILFRGSDNKSSGPQTGWMSCFMGQLSSIEDILEELYKLIGLKTTRIISKADEPEDGGSISKTLSEEANFKIAIDEYIHICNVNAHNICALINVTASFDVPIPVVILIRLASKIAAIRAKDKNSIPKNPIKSYVYSKTRQFIEISLMICHSLVQVLGTDMLPFIPHMNTNLRRLLEWARTFESDEVRAKILSIITSNLDRFSLNANIEQVFLEELLNDCIAILKVKPQIEALNCLERIVTTYSGGYLKQDLHSTIKRCVIHVCLDIYVNSSNISLVSIKSRRSLIQLLLIIMNQLQSSSTTEVGAHLLMLIEANESDPDIKLTIRRAFKVGFTHRPIIVSHEHILASHTEDAEIDVDCNIVVNDDIDVDDDVDDNVDDDVEIIEQPQKELNQKLQHKSDQNDKGESVPLEQPHKRLKQSLHQDSEQNDKGESVSNGDLGDKAVDLLQYFVAKFK